MTRDELLRALDELIIPHGKLAEYWTIYEFIIDSTKEEDKMPALLKPVKVYGGGVSTERGYKFRTAEEARDNASKFVERCAEILNERSAKEGG